MNASILLLSLNFPIPELSTGFVIQTILWTISTTLELSLKCSQINFISNKVSHIEFLVKQTLRQ